MRPYFWICCVSSIVKQLPLFRGTVDLRRWNTAQKKYLYLVEIWYFIITTFKFFMICMKVPIEMVFFVYNTWTNKSRDWHIDGVANKSSLWFFMSTNLRKIPVKISWHSDVWSTRYSDLSNASLDILKTMDSKQFRVLIYHCFLMKKKHSASSAMAWKVLRGFCSIKNNHLSVVCWVYVN